MYRQVQEICKEKGITISKLETELGFPRGSIYKWTEHSPSIEKVKKVAEYLKLPIDSFVPKDDE